MSKESKVRSYLPLAEEEMEHLATLFMKKMSSKSRKNVGFVLTELEKKKIDSFQLIEELFSKFFVDFFPFDVKKIL